MRAFALLATLALLSGCIAADPPVSSTDGPRSATAADPAAASPPTGPDAGSAATHGQPRREESPVTVQAKASGYEARRTVTVTNDFGGAAQATVTLATVNGGIAAEPGTGGGYLLRADLVATGATEQEARDRLATMTVRTTDDLEQGHLSIGLEVEFQDDDPQPLPLPLPAGPDTGGSRGAHVTAKLPPEPAIAAVAATTNGPIAVAGLHGPAADLATTNGPVAVKGAWDRLEAGTTNGPVALEGTFNAVHVDTQNGAVHGRVASTASGGQSASTTNGAIHWTVVGLETAGVKLSAATTNGAVESGLPGIACDDGRGRCEGTTPDAQGKEVLVDLRLRTTNGGIHVEGE